MSYSSKTTVAPVLFLLTCAPDKSQLVIEILSTILKFLADDVTKLHIHNSEAKIDDIEGMKKAKDKILKKMEKEKANVVVWADEGLVTGINRLFFFQDVTSVHIGQHSGSEPLKHHITNAVDVLSGTKALLSVLGEFAGLPGFQRDMAARYEHSLLIAKKKKQQKVVDEIVEKCAEISCPVCGGTKCGRVKQFLATLPDAQRKMVEDQINAQQK